MANKWLRPKYDVISKKGLTAECLYHSTDPNDIDSPFVLMPRKDPAALTAMIAYAQSCEPELAAEIRDWLRKIAEAPPAFGSQGLRNLKAKRLQIIDDLV